MAKEFLFRGKTLEELKQMDVREFAKCLKSRQRRTVLRQFQKIENFIKRCERKITNKKSIKTHSRDIVIVPKMIGMSIQVYNGKTFIPVRIIEEMLGHRLGEFSLTRSRIKHGAAGVGATRGSKFKSVK